MNLANAETLTSTLPPRLDRLPWSRWHRRVIIALGITWILDGLEVTMVGSLGPTLQQDGTLGLAAAEVGYAEYRVPGRRGRSARWCSAISPIGSVASRCSS